MEQELCAQEQTMKSRSVGVPTWMDTAIIGYMFFCETAKHNEASDIKLTTSPDLEVGRQQRLLACSYACLHLCSPATSFQFAARSPRPLSSTDTTTLRIQWYLLCYLTTYPLAP